MKIAIFHNLNSGGGLNILVNLCDTLSHLGHHVDIYSHNSIHIKNAKQHFFYPIKKTTNSFQQITQIINELYFSEKNISHTITNKNYDYIFIFPCFISQSPHILRFLPKNKTYYFFLETKREYYEKTSFDYYTPKRIFSRLIRYPLKILDQINCKTCTHIISDSIYSQNNLQKFYKKKSVVLYPGMKQINPKKLTIRNKNNFLSLGIQTMLKGHHISATLVKNVHVYGNISHENIRKFLPTKAVIHNSANNKSKIYQKYSNFLANQISEPFGLTTLEATSNNCFVYGSNFAGTSEIIQNNINGILLPISNLLLSRNILNTFNKTKIITIQKICIIDWKDTTQKLLKILEHE